MRDLWNISPPEQGAHENVLLCGTGLFLKAEEIWKAKPHGFEQAPAGLGRISAGLQPAYGARVSGRVPS